MGYLYSLSALIPSAVALVFAVLHRFQLGTEIYTQSALIRYETLFFNIGIVGYLVALMYVFFEKEDRGLPPHTFGKVTILVTPILGALAMLVDSPTLIYAT